jgi:protease-4
MVDALGSSSHVAREVIGEETIVNYTVKQDIFERFAERLGSSVAQVISTQWLNPTLR